MFMMIIDQPALDSSFLALSIILKITDFTNGIDD